MGTEQDSGREAIINEIITKLQEKLPKKEAALVVEFTRQFYRNVSYADLLDHSVMDLYGAILSHWEIIKNRKPGDAKVRIYNPHYEQHAWQSTHTIIEIIYDDMPFIVDSLRMEINRLGLTMHLIIHRGGLKLRRNKKGDVVEFLPIETPVGDDVSCEAPLYFEIDRQTQPDVLTNLKESLEKVLADVSASVEDWSKMRGKIRDALSEIEKMNNPALDPDEVIEAKDFLRWLENDHFTFLGYRYYNLVGKGNNKALELVPDSGLGVLRDISKKSTMLRNFADLTPEARKMALSNNILIISKTNTRATVHRPAYTDYIGVKVFDEKGILCGEHRFIGLYTSSAYNSNPKYIPFVRRKVALILKNSHLSITGHGGKALLNILETFPRDDLFQATAEELSELALGIVHLQERKQIRLFARKDIYGRFLSCLVFVPRERFTTELAQEMEKVLMEAFDGLEVSYTTRFSDSVLARIHFVVRIEPKKPLEYSLEAIEKKLIAIGRSWVDELRDNLSDSFGEERGNLLFQKYCRAFPTGYRETFTARTAIYDIEHMEFLSEGCPLTMSFYRPLEEQLGSIRFKLFRPGEAIPLSDALPIFENMGLRVMGERPYEIRLSDGQKFWINDFSMLSSQNIGFDIEKIQQIFQDTFFNVWMKNGEDDSFNRLVLTARLNWREISVIRAYTKYLRQTGFTYSQFYIEETFAKFPVIARMLVQLFLLRFDPDAKSDEDLLNNLEVQIKKALDNITILDEDRILRRIYEVIIATLRTNYFQSNSKGKSKYHLSFKIESAKVPELPLPLPLYEIFVYSPRLEGIHLRSSKVARGGIRWSDRREDFRTEVLGLMKAQNVKNSVIVPSGAKGGFVTKVLPVNTTREAVMEEVIGCYKMFISGMLDITDNIIANEIVHPQQTVRYDEDDPYFVVAADKGTATFSDIANEIAGEYNFWLGDAFASGGSSGFDHKKMGITARGAWESVKHHFLLMGHDIQKQDFTVVGIGDMAGDVFGNGMLLSRHIKLVGAFNHQHIFLDPDPDPETSFVERERLFKLPRSSWEDYNAELISKGGGIYRRTSKAIRLTPEVKKLLNIKKDFVVPNELIRCILTAKVDLLWNGGIGTYVKSSDEEHADAGDRANDALRVNGRQVQASVVGEGGNLGCTQLGRVEYALNGGRIFTDFIDNAGGVDCSDHEVNVKILLNAVVTNGDMTHKQRNELLVEMTDDVAGLVLHNNYRQIQAISLAATRAHEDLDLHHRLIQEMVKDDLLDIDLEFLPDDAKMLERKSEGKGLTAPELSVLFAYCKNILKQEILSSDVPEDPYLSTALALAFPRQLREKYHTEMAEHRLSADIIGMLLSNAIVNEMGFTFVHQLHHETGAPMTAIVRAYTITRNVFKLTEIQAEIAKLDHKISSEIQGEMIFSLMRLIRRATRWLLRNRRIHLDITSSCEHFSPSVELLTKKMESLLVGSEKEKFLETKQRYIDAGVPTKCASKIAANRGMISAFDIIEAANVYGFNLEDVASTYFTLGEHLELGWFRGAINAQAIESEWDDLSKEACRDDLDWQQRGLTIAVLQGGVALEKLDDKLEAWVALHKDLIQRWHAMLCNLKSSSATNFVMFSVAVRELMDLTQTSFHSARPPKVESVSDKRLDASSKAEEKTEIKDADRAETGT